jgi:biopolymer transport protein ExbB
MSCSGLLANARRTPWVGICLLAVLVLVFSCPAVSTCHAQDGEKEAPAPAAKDTKPPSLIIHIIKSVGWFMGALLLGLSIGLVALIVLLFMDLRMSLAIPPGFVDEFTETVNQRKFKEAYEMAKEDGSFLGRVLTTGMARLQYGIEDAREAAFNMVDSIKAGKDQLISYLAVIGTLGPLLGLVGTVYGMILSFMDLGKEGDAPSPQKLAGNLAHALVVTMLGIGLSVPAIFAHTFFRNRLIRVSMDTGNIADDLLTQMYHNSKKAAPPAAPPAPAADGRTAPIPPHTGSQKIRGTP